MFCETVTAAAEGATGGAARGTRGVEGQEASDLGRAGIVCPAVRTQAALDAAVEAGRSLLGAERAWAASQRLIRLYTPHQIALDDVSDGVVPALTSPGSFGAAVGTSFDNDHLATSTFTTSTEAAPSLGSRATTGYERVTVVVGAVGGAVNLASFSGDIFFPPNAMGGDVSVGFKAADPRGGADNASLPVPSVPVSYTHLTLPTILLV